MTHGARLSASARARAVVCVLQVDTNIVGVPPLSCRFTRTCNRTYHANRRRGSAVEKPPPTLSFQLKARHCFSY